MKPQKPTRKSIIFISLLGLLLTISCSLLTSTPQSIPTPMAEIDRSPPPTLPNTVPELIQALSEENAEARIGAARALGARGVEAKEAIPALTQNLYYVGPYEIREASAWALGEMGIEAKPAVPYLTIILLTDFVHARRAASEALGKIDDTSAIPALAQALYDEDAIVTMDSAKAIEQLIGIDFVDNLSENALNEDGIPRITIAAIRWWREKGQYQNWTQN